MTITLHKVGSSLNRLAIGETSIWFSYETPIALETPTRKVVATNTWSSMTGKHLSQIDGGDQEARIARVDYNTFLAALSEVTYVPDAQSIVDSLNADSSDAEFDQLAEVAEGVGVWSDWDDDEGKTIWKAPS